MLRWLWWSAAVVVGLPVALVILALCFYQVVDVRSGTLEVASHEREYLLHVPASYDAARPTPRGHT